MGNQYDIIILGSGQPGQAALKTLTEQGQRVLFIDIEPKTIATLLCQKSLPTIQNPSPAAHGTFIIQQQTLTTSECETRTYHFHVQEAQPAASEDPSIHQKYSAPVMPLFQKHSLLGSSLLGIPGNSLSEKLIRRKAKNVHKPAFNHTLIDTIPLDKNQTSAQDSDNKEHGEQPQVQAEEKQTETPYKPVFLERDLRLRKKLIHHKRKQIEEKKNEVEEVVKNVEVNHTVQTEENTEQAPKETFKPIEEIATPSLLEGTNFNTFPPKVEHKFTSLLENPIISNSEKTEVKAENHSLLAHEPMEEDNTPSVEEENRTFPSLKTDQLKIDAIEFEEPYGANTFEDFFPPFSQNNRKRQEMDKIEKRKIALRGLHNLINNLG